SDPELQLGEILPPKASGSGKQTAYAPPDHGTIDAEAAVGGEPPAKGGSSKAGKSPQPRAAGPKSPPPKASSDRDVRLGMEGSDLNFQIATEGDVQVGKPPSPPPSSHKGKPESPPDSGVRIVSLDKSSDSDVKIVPDDSDVPLGGSTTKTPSDS